METTPISIKELPVLASGDIKFGRIGRTIKVRLVAFNPDVDCFGMAEYGNNNCWVCMFKDPEETLKVLIHELTHYYLYYSGLDNRRSDLNDFEPYYSCENVCQVVAEIAVELSSIAQDFMKNFSKDYDSIL